MSSLLSNGRAASVVSALALVTAAASSLPAHADVLFNNGSASTGPVTANGTVAPGGTSWSESSGGTIGWSNSTNSSGNRFTLADDFTVAAGTSWSISSINVFAYVTDVGIDSSPITGVSLRIWSGTPGAGGASVIWGDLTTNLMTSSTFANIYRSELNFPDLQRPLWDQSVATNGLVLGQGTYWVEWLTTTRSTSVRAFGVPVHVDGLTAAPGANGMQSSYAAATGVTTWSQAIDSGVQQVQDIPFVISGSVSAVPEPATAALWMLGVGALVTAARRRPT